MTIRPSTSIRQNYNEISSFCRETGEPVYLTKNGEGDLVVMNIEAFTQREKMLILRAELLTVEEERLAGHHDISVEQFVSELDCVIEEVTNGRYSAI